MRPMGTSHSRPQMQFPVLESVIMLGLTQLLGNLVQSSLLPNRVSPQTRSCIWGLEKFISKLAIYELPPLYKANCQMTKCNTALPL